MILIADDNRNVRRLIRELIGDLNTEIIECEDGKTAIELFEQHGPDVVLMDVNMDPVDGITATRRILERSPDAKIIIVTEHHDPSIRELSRVVGAAGFIGKDDLTLLRDLLIKILPGMEAQVERQREFKSNE